MELTCFMLLQNWPSQEVSNISMFSFSVVSNQLIKELVASGASGEPIATPSICRWRSSVGSSIVTDVTEHRTWYNNFGEIVSSLLTADRTCRRSEDESWEGLLLICSKNWPMYWKWDFCKAILRRETFQFHTLLDHFFRFWVLLKFSCLLRDLFTSPHFSRFLFFSEIWRKVWNWNFTLVFFCTKLAFKRFLDDWINDLFTYFEKISLLKCISFDKLLIAIFLMILIKLAGDGQIWPKRTIDIFLVTFDIYFRYNL